jgi:hypothetical protein
VISGYTTLLIGEVIPRLSEHVAAGGEIAEHLIEDAGRGVTHQAAG